MKAASLANLLLIGVLLSGTANLCGESVFETSFEDSIYKAGSELPRGQGRIQCGRWGGGDPGKGFSALIADDKALSGSQSLVLERTEALDESAQAAKVWAGFGPDSSGNTRFTKPLSLSFAFLVSKAGGADGGCVTFTLTGASAATLCSVVIGSDGSVIAQGRGSSESVGEVVADRWYFLEIIGPDSEQPGGRLTVNLFEAKAGGERGDLVGSVEASELSAGSIYGGFSLSNTMFPSKAFFDDFQVVIKE